MDDTAMKICFGATRIVLLVGKYAVKVPRFTLWHTFLWGLLANMQERLFWETRWPELCPILFSLPGGWIVIMPRLEPLTEEFDGLSPAWGITRDYCIPVEHKRDSFGWLSSKIVAIDYGS